MIHHLETKQDNLARLLHFDPILSPQLNQIPDFPNLAESRDNFFLKWSLNSVFEVEQNKTSFENFIAEGLRQGRYKVDKNICHKNNFSKTQFSFFLLLPHQNFPQPSQLLPTIASNVITQYYNYTLLHRVLAGPTLQKNSLSTLTEGTD